VSFAAITFHVASQGVFIVVSVYFFIDSVRKLLVTPSYIYSADSKLRYINSLEKDVPKVISVCEF
jgi:hypothetical protein